MDPVARLRLADDFMRRFAAALRGAQLYAPSHPLVQRAFEGLDESITQLLDDQPTIAVGLIGQEIIVGDVPLPRAAESMGEMIRRLKSLGIERIAFDRGVTPEELQTLALTHRASRTAPGPGRSRRRGGRSAGDLQQPAAHSRRTDSRPRRRRRPRRRTSRPFAGCIPMRPTSPARCGKRRRTEGTPDPKAARALVDGLAQAVSANRTALIALTALKNYDNYTFTHMVNVSILTMSQARALGLEGTTLRELGLAGLDARHRQGAHAHRDPQQAREADRRGIRGDADARRRRRRNPAAHAGDAGDRTGDRVRAPPAPRRHRLPVQGVAAPD